LREFAKMIDETQFGHKHATLDDIRDILDEIDWIWGADVRE